MIDVPVSIEAVRAQLSEAAEETYRAFSAALLPGVTDLLGVRLPALRRIAKGAARAAWARDWLAKGDAHSFEETMLAGFVTALMPVDSLAERLALTAQFVPRIANWSVCDSFCNSLKDVRSDRAQTFAFLQPYLHSTEEFPARFGAVMLLSHFVCDAWRDAALDALVQIPAQGHYARMAVAWALQTFHAQYPDAVETLLRGGRLDAQTRALTVRKIAESRQTTPETRARLRQII